MLTGGERACTRPATPFVVLCSRRPSPKRGAGAEEPRGTLPPEGQGEQPWAGCLTHTQGPYRYEAIPHRYPLIELRVIWEISVPSPVHRLEK